MCTLYRLPQTISRRKPVTTVGNENQEMGCEVPQKFDQTKSSNLKEDFPRDLGNVVSLVFKTTSHISAYTACISKAGKAKPDIKGLCSAGEKRLKESVEARNFPVCAGNLVSDPTHEKCLLFENIYLFILRDRDRER